MRPTHDICGFRMKRGSKWLSAMVVGLVASAGLFAARSQAAVERVTHVTTAGKAAEIGHHARWNANCDSAAAPRLSIEQPPAHGRLCVVPGPIRPVMSRSGVGLNCVGRTIEGVHVVYSPHAAFTGIDTLRYGLDAPEGHVSRDVSIMIEPAGGSPASATTAVTGDVQDPGPMPECPHPVS